MMNASSSKSSVVTTILSAVADAEGTSPLDLPQPLYSVIDPDALEAIFDQNSTNVSVEFCYLSYQVRVQSDGSVTLLPATPSVQANGSR